MRCVFIITPLRAYLRTHLAILSIVGIVVFATCMMLISTDV